MNKLQYSTDIIQSHILLGEIWFGLGSTSCYDVLMLPFNLSVYDKHEAAIPQRIMAVAYNEHIQ